MTDKERLILAMDAGASALENHRAAETMSYWNCSGGEYSKPESTIKYLDAVKILRDEAARLAVDEGTVDNICCPFCGELFDGGEATNYDASCTYADCPHCKKSMCISQSVTYTVCAD